MSAGRVVPVQMQMAQRTRRARRFDIRARLSVWIPLVFVCLLLGVAILAPYIARTDPNAQDLVGRLKGPGPAHLLGTDDFGRDVLSRIIFGARVSVFAAVETLLVSSIIGTPLGLLAGYVRGKTDAVLSRGFDALMSMPALILAMTIVAVLGPGLTNAMFAVGIIFAPRYFRVARGVTLGVRAETFIEACHAIGCSTPYTIIQHVLPNVIPPLLVQSSVILGLAVSAEASLSFIGLGVAPPTASWGAMLANAASYLNTAPFLAWAPGIAITLTVLAFSMLGQSAATLIDRASKDSVLRGL